MATVLFDSLTPQKYIWVSPTGNNSGTGSQTSPLKTIQAAVNKATAGTAIMVTAGVYYENVKLPTKALGTPDNPIWLISADGPQAAKVVGVSQTVGTIYGYGTDNYVVQGFEIQGGFRGIQFSQSGSDFTNLVNNVLVIDNVIHDTKEDGIKIGQANNAYAIGNTVYNVLGEGIDFLAVNSGFISYNEVYNAKSSAAAIFAKGGSTGVLIDHNYVHDIPFGDGISIGGQSLNTGSFRPGYTKYEAKDVVVSDNYVEDVDQNPVIVNGALDSQIIDNYLVTNPAYFAAVVIKTGWSAADTPSYSANIEVANNILVGKQNVVVFEGNKNNISIHDNAASGVWTTSVGPDGHFTPTTPTPQVVAGTSVTGTSAGETLLGTAGSDSIYGLGGADKLYGQAGSDSFDAGSGSDYLFGGLGADVLTGSAGNDVFVFNTALFGGIDRVTDFAHGYDTFRVENGVFHALGTAGKLASDAFYSGSAAHDSTDRIIYNPTTGALSYDADGTGSVAPVQFAVFPKGLTMTASDFIIW